MIDLLLKLFVSDYQNTSDVKVRKDYGLLGSFFGLVTNLVLFVGKILIGILTGMFSVIADSVNNLSDFGNNLISVIGVKITAKPADDDHPYGHQRMEYVISLVIACVIIGLGMVLIYQGAIDAIEFVKSMIDTGKPVVSEMDDVHFVVTLIVLLSAIFIKVMQSYVYFSLGKRISSMQMRALGKDALNDVISTCLVFAGLVITRLTTYNLDFIFTWIVSVLVILSGISIMKEAINKILGEKPSKEVIEKLTNLVLSEKDVLGVHDLSVHMYGQETFAVIHVEVDAERNVIDSHEVCDTIERKTMDLLGIHLTVHMDPVLVNDEETKMYKELVHEALDEYAVKLRMHDFRIVSGKQNVNLIFDVIVPNDIDDQEHRHEITSLIRSYCEKKTGKSVYPVIDFDDSLSDFLSGTDAEE